MSTLLVDGNNLSVRLWKGSPELNTSKGYPVHVIFGVLRAIKAALVQFKTDSAVIVWDGTPTVRTQIYNGYKAKRKQAREEHTPEEELSYKMFKRQMQDLKNILSCFGVHQYFEEKTEADDVISVLAQSLGQVVILSEDKDFIQLVSKSVTLHRPMTKLTYTADNFQELTKKANPKQYLNFRVLNGDDSDEIPPVPGFGGKEGKRAHQLIDEHHSVEAILAHKELNKGKVMEGLFNSKDIIIRNFLLMDLKHSFDYLHRPVKEDMILGEFNEAQIKSTLMKYEFFSLLSGLREFLASFSSLTKLPVF